MLNIQVEMLTDLGNDLDFSKKEEVIQSSWLYKKCKLAEDLQFEKLKELLAYFVTSHAKAGCDFN